MELSCSSSTRRSPSVPELTLLYDGGCPLCLREVRSLKRLDAGRGLIAFTDIDADGYDPDQHAGINYRQAMGRMHAIRADGTVITDVEVFRQSYNLVGLGWLYAPTRWPLVHVLVDALYTWWANRRLQLTRRPDLEVLCSERCDRVSGQGLQS